MVQHLLRGERGGGFRVGHAALPAGVRTVLTEPGQASHHSHQLQQVLAELHPDEAVHQGVQAAPEHRQELGDVVCKEQLFLLSAVDRTVGRAQGAHKQEQRVRQLAQEERRHYRQDHLEGTVTLEAARLTQRHGDGAVAEGHDQERHHEAQGDLRALDSDQQCQVVGWVGDRVRRTAAVVDGGVNHLRDGEHQGQGPDDGRRQPPEVGGLGAVAIRRHGLGDGEVAVHADAGEQEYAAV